MLQADVDARAHAEPAFYASERPPTSRPAVRGGFGPRAAAELHAAQEADPAWFRAQATGFTRTALAQVGAPVDQFWLALADAERESGAAFQAEEASRRVGAR